VKYHACTCCRRARSLHVDTATRISLVLYRPYCIAKPTVGDHIFHTEEVRGIFSSQYTTSMQVTPAWTVQQEAVLIFAFEDCFDAAAAASAAVRQKECSCRRSTASVSTLQAHPSDDYRPAPLDSSHSLDEQTTSRPPRTAPHRTARHAHTGKHIVVQR